MCAGWSQYIPLREWTHRERRAANHPFLQSEHRYSSSASWDSAKGSCTASADIPVRKLIKELSQNHSRRLLALLGIDPL